jgi:hypothetical protein
MSIFVINHEIVNAIRGGSDSAGPAQNLQINPRILGSFDKRPANRVGMVSAMAKIIPVSFNRPRLPRSLLRDGWWLQSSPCAVVPFAKSSQKPSGRPQSKPRPKASHLTLVHSGK